jgi:peptidyl-prolyl cis-trans isomerase A (cyclophilin A)
LVAALAFVAVAHVACGTGPTTMPAVASAPGESPSSSPLASSLPPSAFAPAVHHAATELDPALATARAPDTFLAKFTTTKGDFVIEVHRDWAPNGADRFYNLVKLGVFDDTRFFRAIEGFMVQFGIAGDPQVAAKWRDANIQDDPVTQSNLRGYVSFAQTGRPNSRTTQVFIDYRNNSRLDASGFAPFGKVVQGMEVVDSLYKGYGEGAPDGNGPNQALVQTQGNTYLDREFPLLDHILGAQVVTQQSAPPEPKREPAPQ